MHSTRERLSSYWQRINKYLHLPFEEASDPLSLKQQRLITALEVIRIEDFISPHVGVGRPPEDRIPVARAFIAKAVYGHATTRSDRDRMPHTPGSLLLRKSCF